MKNVKANPMAALAEPAKRPWGWILLGLFLSLFLLVQIYSPALNGQFLYDDEYLPFTDVTAPDRPLSWWLASARPILMLTYWVNFQTSGMETFSYHLWNVLLHFVNALLVVALVRRLLERVETNRQTVWLLSGFAGSLFLLHPIQTEAVAYVASRSDVLSTLFYYAAFAIFLYRKDAELSWARSAAVAIVFGLGVLTKEQAVTLPVLLMLTDYYWNPGFTFEGIKKNWRLYVPLILGALAIIPRVLDVLRNANSAGFKLPFTWYQYLFTQCKVVWVYVRLYLLPAGQNGDYDFAIVTALTDFVALAGMILLVCSIVASFVYRRRYPLFTYGWLMFLLLLTPTSSVLPILDPIVERRMYLPLLGLLLMSVDLLRRVKWERTALAGALAAVLVVSAFLTYQRNAVWSNAVDFWSDVVAKSPNKWRPRFQLGYAYMQQRQFGDAVKQFEAAEKIDNTDQRLYTDWGLALDGLGDTPQAIAKLKQAINMKPSDPASAHIYTQLGSLYGKQGKSQEALEALDKAAQMGGNTDLVYAYRGNVYASNGDLQKAQADFEHALQINPANVIAKQGMSFVQQRLTAKP